MATVRQAASCRVITADQLGADDDRAHSFPRMLEVDEVLQRTGRVYTFGPVARDTPSGTRPLAGSGGEHDCVGLDDVPAAWRGDDQLGGSFALNIPGMLSTPYTVELNDLVAFGLKGLTGPEFLGMFTDHLEQLIVDSSISGRVLALALHPFIIGQPSRAKYLDQALDYVVSHPDVWLTTSDEIAAYYAGASAGTVART
jgi:hypothetical protein